MSRSGRNAKAEEYFRRAPGYSAELAIDLDRYAHGTISEQMESLRDVLLVSHKFALPQDGMLFDVTTEGMVAGTHLPFPVCVFEYHHGQPTVVLAIEQDGILVVTTCVKVLQNTFAVSWVVSPVVISYQIESTLSASKVWTTEPFSREVELGDEARSEWTKFAYRSGQVVFQTLSALACTNVTTEVIRPNREARAARPASTLFDYHVLMIDPSKERNPSEDRGGSHASPRTHLRRGHIRKLAWGPRVWVNSCVVNPSALGTVNKDYAIKSSAPVAAGAPEKGETK